MSRSLQAIGIVFVLLLATAVQGFGLHHVVQERRVVHHRVVHHRRVVHRRRVVYHRRYHVRYHRRYHRGRRVRFHRLVWHPMFPGSHEMLVSENEKLDALRLPRIEDDDQLELLEDSGDLVRIDQSRALKIASNLQENRRYCRPWTRDFLDDLSEAFYDKFHQPIQVNSAVRTVQQQKRLRRYNRNAGPIDGDTASTHLTGVTIDISKRGLTRKEHDWINQYFLPMRNAGVIDPIEERRQPVFHVVVFEGYTDWKDNQQQPESNTGTDVN